MDHITGPDDLTIAAGLTESDTTGLPSGTTQRTGRRAVLTGGQAFGPRYRIIGLLGMGGMGEVYRAWDAALSIEVALKVIRPDVIHDPEAAAALERRFKKELLTARQVTHKHVVRIHDLGEIDGIKYLTMPCIDGSNLATILRQENALPVPRALRLLRQIVAGLQAAHDANVIHRDLKPANIMVSPEDQAVIMDFGIARSSAAVDGTTTGHVEGTLAYMAPEQALGGAVDQRSDIYAFGLIAYEMLTGLREKGGDSVAEAKARFVNGVAPMSVAIPSPVRAFVERCVHLDPAQRYQNAGELVAALDRIDDRGQLRAEPRRLTMRLAGVLAGAVIVLAAATYFLGLRSAPVPAAPPEPVKVLIADFDNRTGEPVFDGVLEQAFSVGIEGASFINAYPRTDARRLAAAITQSERLDVERARIVAQREGVKVVLAGAITNAGGRYEVKVSAIDPIPGKTLTTEDATAARADVFKVVGEIASKLRTALGDTTPESARIAAGETFTAASLEAASAYAGGQDLLNNSKPQESLAYFDRALALDPEFARAYASKAVAEFALGRRTEAEALYKRAFALSDRMSEREKYRTYGTYHLTVAPAYDQAIDYYTKLVSQYPGDRARGNLAVAYFYVGNFAKAEEEGARALELFPTVKQKSNVALYAMYASNFESAARRAREAIAADPQYSRGYVPIAIAALDAGDLNAARAAYEKMRGARDDGASRGAMGLADVDLYEGRYQHAIDTLTPAIQVDRQNVNREALAAKFIALADGYLGIGDRTRASSAVQEALKASSTESVQFAAAERLLALNRSDAERLTGELERSVTGYSRVYARLVQAKLALTRGRTADALDLLRDAQKIADLWLVRFDRGVAYVEAERYPEAVAELEACVKRRGEAAAIFRDDVPTYRYLASLDYWLGRARAGAGQTAQAAEHFKKFIARRADARDPLVEDARRRLAGLSA